MTRSDDRGLSNSPNATEQRTERVDAYQFSGDFVVASSRAPGAWIAAEHPMLAVDQLDTEVA